VNAQLESKLNPRRGWGIFLFTALATIQVLGASIAHAHGPNPTVVVKTPSIADPSCVATMGGSCVLRAPHRAMEMITMPEQGLVARMKSADPAQSEANVSITSDLVSRVQQGLLTDDEAIAIASDLQGYEGAAYQIPNFEDLKKSLGFPNDAFLSEDDLKELVSVHLQLTLGVQALTATYLANQLGVSVVSAREGGVWIESEPSGSGPL
jgi:hypothetical protein